MRSGRGVKVAVSIAAMLLVAPFVGLIVQAFADRWFGRSLLPQSIGLRGVREVWSDPVLTEAVINSLTVATVVAAVAVVVAWPAARFLAETRSIAAWAMMAAPVLLPPLVIGDGLATWFVRLGLTEHLAAIAIAHLAIAIPYAALGLVPAFTDELVEIEQSAALSGAGPFRRMVDVVLPAARRHVLIAFALAFTVSWSQYGTSLAIGGGTPMLPLVLVPFVRSDPQIAAVLDLVYLLPPVMLLGAAAWSGTQPAPGQGNSHPESVSNGAFAASKTT